ncbi:hypothetical protein L1049_011932 [Liquidambar formosana]|uniref:VQ domain-containing protein n=1 Tax=Liquidambar formosana TaxID=63359 RepID=A0AAP0RY07_LIQFO
MPITFLLFLPQILTSSLSTKSPFAHNNFLFRTPYKNPSWLYPYSLNNFIVSFENMDVMGGVNQIMKRQKQAKRKRKAIKVVYISSPMKVKTSASEFRAIVQELTGRDSEVARFMETNGADDDFLMVHDQGFMTFDHDCGSRVPKVDPYGESPTSSGSLLESPIDDVLVPQMEANYMGMFPPSLFYDFSQVDVFN